MAFVAAVSIVCSNLAALRTIWQVSYGAGSAECSKSVAEDSQKEHRVVLHVLTSDRMCRAIAADIAAVPPLTLRW